MEALVYDLEDKRINYDMIMESCAPSATPLFPRNLPQEKREESGVEAATRTDGVFGALPS